MMVNITLFWVANMFIKKVGETMICVCRNSGIEIKRTTMIDTKENRKKLKKWIERKTARP